MDLYKNLLLTVAIFSCILVSSTIKAQNHSITVPEHDKNISFAEFAKNIEDAYGYKFFFKNEWVASISIDKYYTSHSLQKTLIDILYAEDISFEFMYDYAIVLYKDASRNYILENILAEGDSAKRIYIGDPTQDGIGNVVKLKGIITSDDATLSVLGGVNIHVDGELKTISHADGSYELDLIGGNHVITYEALGKETSFTYLSIFKSGNLNVTLEEEPFTLSEIVIQEQLADENFEYNIAGKTKIGYVEIQSNPAFLGEVDVIKSIQTLPGVSSVGEIGSGINVRGGSADQNLILFDNAMIFNPTHLFGFFSAFHPDAVKDVNFYKGTIPAEFGGRVSSVLDVKQKEGDYEKINLSGGIGIVSSRLLVDGPIIKEKLSFLVGVRASYSDWMLKSVKDTDIRNSAADFSDFTAKLTYKPSKKDKISATSYASFDKFQLASDTVYKWNNKFVSLTHDHAFNNRISSTLNASVGSYGYTVSSEDKPNNFDWDYGIEFYQIDAKIRYEIEKHAFVIGGDFKNYTIDNGQLIPGSDNSNVTEIRLDESNAYELSGFISDEFQLTNNLSIVTGLRYSTYTLLGPNTINIYEEGGPLNNNTIIDSVTFEKNDEVASYSGLEPRFSIKYQFTPYSQIKAGYSRGYQYMHLISNTTAVTPIDKWIVSNTYVKPQYGDQYSIGYSQRLKEKGIEFSTDLFYKRSFQVPEYRNGADLILNNAIETELVESEGRAYGAELSVKKTEGRLKGTLSYTYSRSERNTNTPYETLQINDGEYYPSNYDRPHNLTITTNYTISKRHSLAVNFLLASGRPYTAPTAAFVVDNIPVVSYGARNQERIPMYHRLDLTLFVKANHKKNKWRGSWAFTIFNIYGRKNAYSIFFESDENSVIRAKKLSILGSIFPSITYNFKF